MHRCQATSYCLRLLLLAVWFACYSFQPGTAGEPSRLQQGVLGQEQNWSTPWYLVESDTPGPTILIAGGVHGNEPAGRRAAEQILHWPIVRGRMIVLPQLNRTGLRANMRWQPAFRNDRSRRDLNRNFPTKERPEQLPTPLSQAIWQFVRQHEPQWVFDLHEGFDFHRSNPKSVGSSVITSPTDESFALAKKMLARVNETVSDESQRFDLLASSGPATGSLARACWEQLGAHSFIVETTFKSQPISLRTRQHRIMMSTALREIGMIAEDCRDVLGGDQHTAEDQTRVALYDAAGTGPSKSNVVRVIDEDPRIMVAHFGPADLNETILNQFHVVVFPGGSGSRQGNAIGETGRDAVKRFVNRGGGLVGICAGAYLCSSHYQWSLDAVNTSVFNKMIDIEGVGRKSMWFRGKAAEVEVEFTEAGSHLLAVHGKHRVRYENGPIVSPGNNPSLADYQVLAWFRSENWLYEPQIGTMVNTPAVVIGKFGEGRVISIGPHFEATSGLEHVVSNAILYAAGRPVAALPGAAND